MDHLQRKMIKNKQRIESGRELLQTDCIYICGLHHRIGMCVSDCYQIELFVALCGFVDCDFVIYVVYTILFSITYKLLLQADQKMYIVQLWHALITLLNIIAVVASVKIFPELHFVKLCSVMLFVIQPVAYSNYVKNTTNCIKMWSQTRTRWRRDGLALDRILLISSTAIQMWLC